MTGEPVDDGARGGDAARGVPPSLLGDELASFWAGLARRLERNGHAWRGTVSVKALSSSARGVLWSLVGTPGRATVDMSTLESVLVALGVGDDLADALGALGAPVSTRPGEARVERARRAEGRSTARRLVASWPESWAATWIDELVAAGVLAGYGPDDAAELVTSVRRVLDAIEVGPASISRIDLAANVLGSSHALDPGTRVERAITRALSHLIAEAAGEPVGSAELDDPWMQLGVHRSLVSGAALTWRLPLLGSEPIASAVRTCDDLSVPFVVTRLVLETVELTFDGDADVLVVENPRVLEFAAQRGASTPMICANGNPSTTVNQLIDGVLSAGAQLRYHGDFDVAGLAMCARMQARGVEPWRMGAVDYLVALRAAELQGVALPVDRAPCDATPWDPGLRDVFDDHRLIVHEERLLDAIVH